VSRAQPKTRANGSSVAEFLDRVENPRRQADARAVCALMAKVTRREPRLWGTSIVGFGSYTLTYADGSRGDWPLTGFSPRKTALTLYIMPGFLDYQNDLADLGEVKSGKSCLYVRDLSRIDQKVLARLIRKSVADLRRRWPTD